MRRLLLAIALVPILVSGCASFKATTGLPPTRHDSTNVTVLGIPIVGFESSCLGHCPSTVVLPGYYPGWWTYGVAPYVCPTCR